MNKPYVTMSLNDGNRLFLTSISLFLNNYGLKISKQTIQSIITIAFFIIFILLISHSYIYRHNIYIFQMGNGSTYSFTADFYPHIAVLVEFRITDRIVSIVHNINHHIPSTWPIQIFHGTANQDFIKNSTLAPLITSGKIFLTLMEIVHDKSKTNALLTNAKFWKQVRGEKILLFQIDSIMCSNSPHKITDYLQYDYIGAPWNPVWHQFDKRYLVGNGGFSLRTRSKLLALIELIPYNSLLPEDVWYAENLHRVNASVAPVNLAKTFSVESIFYERPVGIHRFVWRCDFLRKMSQTCPEAVMVLPHGGCG